MYEDEILQAMGIYAHTYRYHVCKLRGAYCFLIVPVPAWRFSINKATPALVNHPDIHIFQWLIMVACKHDDETTGQNIIPVSEHVRHSIISIRIR